MNFETGTLRLATNPCFDTVTTVRQSDPYSKQVYFKMEADITDVGLRNCIDHFMTTEQLRTLGYFLVEQAKMIEAEQKAYNIR